MGAGNISIIHNLKYINAYIEAIPVYIYLCIQEKYNKSSREIIEID